MEPSDFQRDMTEDGRRFRIRDHHGEWQVYGTAALRHICYCGDLVTAHMVAEALEKAAEGCANQIVLAPGTPHTSPDDWVSITDPEHILRQCDYLSDYGTQWYPPSELTGALGKPFGKCGFKMARCRRRDHPEFQQASQEHSPPSGSPTGTTIAAVSSGASSPQWQFASYEDWYGQQQGQFSIRGEYLSAPSAELRAAFDAGRAQMTEANHHEKRGPAAR